MMERDTVRLLMRALNYYAKRVDGLHQDNDIQPVVDILRVDIDSISKEVQEAIDLLPKQEVNHLTPYLKESKEILQNALKYYMHDLEKAKNTLREKLGERSNTYNIDLEINMADELFKQLSPLN